jgi:hypothetical protein
MNPKLTAQIIANGEIMYKAIELMEKHGGSFASLIAKAYQHADGHNKVALLTAFPEMIYEYVQLATQESKKE